MISTRPLPPPRLKPRPDSRPPKQEQSSPALAAMALAVGAVAVIPSPSLAQSPPSPSGRFEGPAFDRIRAGTAVQMDQQEASVKAVQQALIDSGFHISTGASGTLDLFTLLALTNFRDSQGMEASFSLDAETLQRLDEVSSKAGLKAWEDPTYEAPEAPEVMGQPVRMLVDISEHRLFLYDHQGDLEHIYSVATGDADAGDPTTPGLKMVVVKNPDPESEATRIWGAEKKLVFGKRLLNLSWVNLEEGKVEASDQELHGTYVDDSVGLDISLGCMRLTNPDMEDLYQRVEVNDLVMVRE